MPRKKAKRKLNPRRIKSRSSYYIHELAKVLGVCPNTIHNMVKAGLPVIQGSYPYLIMGSEAIAFIKERQAKSKTASKPDEIYCMSSGCRKRTKIKNREAVLEIVAPNVGNLKAFCEACGTKTNKRISLKKISEFHAVLKLQQLPHPRLIQSFDNSTTCETKKELKNVQI